MMPRKILIIFGVWIAMILAGYIAIAALVTHLWSGKQMSERVGYAIDRVLPLPDNKPR